MKNKRFKIVYSQGIMDIILDQATGVQYLRSSGFSGGMTVLVDRDGKPVIGETNYKEY